jgi:SNF2 family DNA or RNA helicase
MKPLSKATAAQFSPIHFSDFDRIHLIADETDTKFSAGFWNERRGHTVHGDIIKDAPSGGMMKLIQRLPEKKKITTLDPLAYELPATDYNCELIDALFPKNQLSFHDESTKMLYDSILLRSQIADICAEWNAAYRERKEIPDHNLLLPADQPYAPYQQLATFMSVYSPAFGLFMEQGTGKTPVGIATVCNAAWSMIQRQIEEREQAIANGQEPPSNRMFRCLIVAPNNVRANWEAEFLKFATVQGRITVLRGLDIGRVRQLFDAFHQQDGDAYTVVICGYETLTKSWEALQLLDGMNWDLSILDEAHYIKSCKTKRFQTAMKLRDKSDKRMVLTGTPIANSVMDIYAILEFLGRGYSGFSSFDSFRRFYGVYERSDQGYETMVGVQNLPFMRERLARYSFIIHKKEALPDLPDKVYDVHEIELTDKQIEYYSQIAENLALEIERELEQSDMPKSMQIQNVLTKLLKLTQITSGFLSFGAQHDDLGEILAPKHIEYFSPNPKIEALLDLLGEKGPNDKTSIWSCFNASIDYICAALDQCGYNYVQFRGGVSESDRAEAVYRFNYDPACKIWVCNGAAGGTGLNLLGYPPGEESKYETNHNHCIIYDQNWSALIRGQLEDRGHRRGTRCQFRVTDLVAPRTIDEEIRTRVCDKQKLALEVADLKEILNNVFKALKDYTR